MMTLQFVLAILTTLVGQVYDHQTGEGLPNVSVYIPGTSIGTATTTDGYFLLRADIDKKTRIAVSSIGYQTYRFSIQPGQNAGIDIPLQEKNTQLQDVLIRPGANPALPLLKRVREARAMNDQPATAEPDVETQLMLSHIAARQLKRQLGQQSFLPLYHYQRVQGQESVQATMLAQTDYQILLSDLDCPIDFYKNSISVYSTSFLSPLAADGNNFYTYYLVDSTLCWAADSTVYAKHYTVHFKTKNPYYNTFNGEMVIDSSSAALIRMEATVPRQVNANYLHDMRVSQSFDSLNHTLRSEQVSLLLDFAIKSDTSRTFPTVSVQHAKHYPSPLTPHPSPLTSNLSPQNYTRGLTPCVVDSLPLIRAGKWLAYTIQNASMPTGSKLEIGNLSELIHLNPQERVRIGLPLRTSPALWKHLCLEAYAACGVADHAWKGAGTVYWDMPTQRRNMLRFRLADEYIYSDVSDFDCLKRENAVWSPEMGITTALVKELYRGTQMYNSMVRQRDVRVEWESDWTDHVETRLCVNGGRMGYGEPTQDYAGQSSFVYGTLSGLVRLSWQERKVDRYCHRYHVYSHLPVLYVGGEIGSYHLDGREQYDVYGKLQLMLRHHQPLGAAGELDYVVEAGVVVGAVPYSLLHLFDGNQSYAYDPYRFTLMHSYTYAADRYVQLHADWNGQGCLFNLIPGVRVLRLRELVECKVAYGGLSSRHAARLAFPEGRLQSLSVPYVEVGVGIGNILRVADLMSVWRLTHLEDAGAPTWSLRFRFHIDT